MVPPELGELTFRLYSFHSSNASEERVNARFPQRVDPWLMSAHLMKRVSRSWSRPTNDFMVLKRVKRSWISRF